MTTYSELIGKRVESFDNDPTKSITYTVTVASSDGGNKYAFEGATAPNITVAEGNTYRFDTSDSTNNGHPFRFSITENGSHGGGSAYTTGVTTNGTAGSSGAYTQIAVDSETPNILYYQCSSHGYMGNHVTNIGNKINSNLSTMGDLTVGTLFKMPDNTAAKILVADGTSYQESAVSGDATIASGGALTLANSGVSAASYTNSSITVDAKGRVTSASSGAAGVSAGFVTAMAIAL